VCPCSTHQHTVSSAAALVALAAVAREPQGVRLLVALQQGMPVLNAPAHRVLCSCARRISSSCQGTTGSAPASGSSARYAREKPHHSTVASAAALVLSAVAAREPQGVHLLAPVPQGVPVPIAPQHRALCSCARRISSCQGTTRSAPASVSSAQCARAQRTHTPCPLQLRSSH
jgi:hypothetical protein